MKRVAPVRVDEKTFERWMQEGKLQEREGRYFWGNLEVIKRQPAGRVVRSQVEKQFTAYAKNTPAPRFSLTEGK